MNKLSDSFKKLQYRLSIVSAIVLAGFCLGCRQPAPIRNSETISGRTMGTTYSVKYLPQSGTAGLVQIGKSIELELESVNAQMSTYLADSEISRFNQSTSLDWFPVSQQTAQVVQLSLQIFELTDSHFDVTVGPLVELWGFGVSQGTDEMPGDDIIRELLRRVGSDKLEVRMEPPALRKQVKELQVDLSAVAKGHGVDRLAAVLDKYGLENYFVEIGGEVRTKGVGLHGTAWKVGIELPDPETRQVMRVVGLSGRSMATSGDYRNFRTLDGKSFAHFIDPKTGRPAISEITSMTVLADDCATADALATGLIASGESKARELIDKHSLAVLMVVKDGEQLETFESPRFKEWIVSDENLR